MTDRRTLLGGDHEAGRKMPFERATFERGVTFGTAVLDENDTGTR